MPPEMTPHLENPDVQPDTQVSADQMRAAAFRADVLEPTTTRLARAIALLHQLRGFIASNKLALPLDVDQDLTVLVHEDLQARKEQS